MTRDLYPNPGHIHKLMRINAEMIRIRRFVYKKKQTWYINVIYICTILGQ